MMKCAFVSADEILHRYVITLAQGRDSSMRLVLELAEDATHLSRDRVAQIVAAEPSVAIIDLGESMTGLRVVEMLAQEAPGMGIIAAGPVVEADTLLRIIHAGASEYLPRPFGADDVAAALHRIRRRLGVTRQEDEPGRAEVTTVFSPKGGVGVTTVAVNLAVMLQKLTGKSTLLLDLAPEFGTAALTMGLQPRYSYVDVIQNFHRIDEELARSFLEVHDSGVQVLSSPPSPGDPGGPSTDGLGGVLRLYQRYFSQIVIDGGSRLTVAVDRAVAESHHRILVATPELPTIRNLKRAIDLFGSHVGNGKKPWHVVLNQYAEGVGLNPRDVERALGIEIGTVIPRQDTLITESINLGRPAVLAGRSSFARSIEQLGGELVGPDRVVVARRGLIGTFFRPLKRRPALAQEGN